jgi:hypothetical protein
MEAEMDFDEDKIRNRQEKRSWTMSGVETACPAHPCNFERGTCQDPLLFYMALARNVAMK